MQLTEEQLAVMENGMKANAALRDEILPKMKKLDAFDEAKFAKAQDDIGTALQLGQDLRAEKAEREKLETKLADLAEKQKELEAAHNRPQLVMTKDDQQAEVNAKGKSLFKQFAQHDGSERITFDAFFKQAVTDEVEKKALSVNSDPNGGYLVTPEFGGIISTYIYESSPMRQLASVMTIGTDRMDYVTDNDQAGWGWVGETEVRPDTATPVLGEESILVNEMYAMPNITQKLIDDAVIDIEAWIAGKIAEVFARGESAAFISGNGVKKPLGLLTPAAGTNIALQQVRQVPLGAANGVTYNGLVALQNSIKEPYQKNAAFMFQRSTNQALFTMKDGQDRPIFNMTYDKQTGANGQLMGMPTYFAADMPAVAANSLAVAYGDFKKAYLILDRIGIRTQRDPFTNRPYVRFYTTKRVGGGIINYEAYAIGKIAAS